MWFLGFNFAESGPVRFRSMGIHKFLYGTTEKDCFLLVRLGFRVRGAGLIIIGLRVQGLAGLGLRVWSLGFGASGLGVKVASTCCLRV